MNEVEEKKISEIEVYDYKGKDYKTAMRFESWRVAYLNHGDTFNMGKLPKIERPMLSDEAFILLEGEAILYIGKQLDEIKMEPFKIYNVPKGVWHNIKVTEGTRTLIIENEDTSKDNTEYIYFD